MTWHLSDNLGLFFFCFVSIRDVLNTGFCLSGVVLNSVACCQSQSLNHMTLYLEHFILIFFFIFILLLLSLYVSEKRRIRRSMYLQSCSEVTHPVLLNPGIQLISVWLYVHINQSAAVLTLYLCWRWLFSNVSASFTLPTLSRSLWVFPQGFLECYHLVWKCWKLTHHHGTRWSGHHTKLVR